MLSLSFFLLASRYFCFKEELDSFSMKINKMSSSDVAATSNNNELSSYDDYHLVVDPEYKAYIRQKKKLNEQIHDHWKLELVKHVSKQANVAENAFGDIQKLAQRIDRSIVCFSYSHLLSPKELS